MSIESTKDIIKQSKKFHHLLANYYHELSEKSDKARLKLLIDYLEERERQIEETLSDIELTSSSNILNSWFSHSPCKAKFNELSSLVLAGSESIDEVIDQFTQIDDCLIDLYSELANKSINKDVRDFFSNLVQLEENHKIKAIKNASQIEDL